MAAIRDWLKGRKTYLLSGALLLTLLVLVAMGRLTPHVAYVLVLVAAFGFPVTFRAALAHHQDEVVGLLQEIAITGTAVATRNVPAALGEGRQAAQDGINLVRECQQEATQA